MHLPNLYIAGAMKSGTTSLHHLLCSHPEIFAPERQKEIHFFDVEETFDKGLSWLASYYEGADGFRYRLQTSPMYLFIDKVPERIAEATPNAKLLFIVRNPVDRAYSHYWHEVAHGCETNTFEQALLIEDERIEKDFFHYRHFSYKARGRYCEQLLRFYSRFPEDRIHIIQFESMISGPVTEELSRFLRLDDRFQPVVPARNKTRRVKNRRLQRLLCNRGNGPIDSAIKKIVNKINTVDAPFPAMQEQTKKELQDYFCNDVEALSRLTGRRFDWF